MKKNTEERKKILYFISRLPECGSSRLDNFLNFISGFTAGWDVYCIIQQSLFLDDEAVKKVKKTGAAVLSVKKENSAGSAVEQIIKNILQKYRFSHILFDSLYYAKYYLYYIEKFSEYSVPVMDARHSQFLLEMKLKSANGNIDYIRDKEIPVYSYFDVIMVSDKTQESFIGKELPKAQIINLKNMKPAEVLKTAVHRKKSLDASRIEVREYDLQKGAAGTLNGIFEKTDSSKKYLLVMPRRSQTPAYFEERLVYCMESNDDNRVVMPATNIYFGRHSSEKIPPPDKKWEFNEFLKKNLIGNYAEWRHVNTIAEPCFMLRTRLISEIGLLDEKYESLYYSLLDYGYRIFQAGFRQVQNLESFIYVTDLSAFTYSYNYADQRRLTDKWGIRTASFLETLK